MKILMESVRPGMVYRCLFSFGVRGEWRVCLLGPFVRRNPDMACVYSFDPAGAIHLYEYFWDDDLEVAEW